MEDAPRRMQPQIDAARVLDRLRRGDEVAIRESYQMVFAGEMGRLVLAHILSRAGVGAIRGPGVATATRDYLDGKADGALEIMNDAGFDAPSAVVMVMTENLEGRDDAPPDDFAEPDPPFD